MAKKLLGLRLCEHDSNISYFDGSKVFYLKSERFYNQKYHAYDNLWEWKNDIKKIFNIDYKDIDEIAVVIDPWRNKLPVDNEEFYPAIEYEYLPVSNKVYRINHHLAHALSCWPLYNERPKYEIIIDGFGDINNSWTVIKDNKILKRGYQNKNGSLGLSMCKAAQWLNIESDQYGAASKLMGLQSYGKIVPPFRETLNYDMHSIDSLFDTNNFNKFLNSDLLAALQPLDWIRTVHDKVSDILINFFEEVTDGNYDAEISYSGGVAQNVIWNTALKNKFKNLIIPPHCNDEGLSLGALEYLRIKNNIPKFKLNNFPYIQSDESPTNNPNKETIIETAEHLKNNKIVAWYQNNGEIGPRALGNRSLLLNPLIKNGKNIINTIKKRETYRPFGASILKEYVKEYFGTNIYNPHMLYVGKTTKKDLKCITHVDGTCRFQSVDKSNQIYYSLIKEFYEITGCPLLLNTSFNVNGKPIMSKINDAKYFFNNSDIDVLVVGNKIYKKIMARKFKSFETRDKPRKRGPRKHKKSLNKNEKDRKELEDTRDKVRVEYLFPNIIAIKNLNLSNLKIIGKKFKKTFESKIKTTLKGNTLFDKSSINYLNIQLTETLSYLLKPYCKNFVFNVADIWINRYETNDYQGSHIHPGDFSFIIYYKINKSYTVFNSPVKNILESSNNKFFNRDCEPNTKEGDMIVFPSYLEHWVKPNSNNITVSGNIKIIELIK